MERTTQTPIEWERITSRIPGTKTYKGANDPHLIVIIEKHAPEDGGGWHLSMSHPSRYPTWDELADARYKFIPDRVTMAMIAPPRKEFVNLHNTCLHLWEIQPERFKNHMVSG